MAKLGLVGLGMVRDSGATRASRLADIYIKTHTASNGKVTDPSVYQEAIDKYLTPFSSSLVVQSKIATLQNSADALTTSEEDIGNTLADLQLREHNSMYITEDNGSASFRNPKYVASVSSESLDALVASVASTIDEKKSLNKETAQLETDLGSLMKKADRMRKLSNDLDSGKAAALNGYGYYVDADPNTGKVSGASILPTDVDSKDLSDGMTRTNTVIAVGSTKIPVYLPSTKNNYGQQEISFGGRKYKGDGSLLRTSDDYDLNMNNPELIPTNTDDLTLGKLYKTFSGKKNVDGSPEEKYLYVGYDNKIYNIDKNKPSDNSFLESLKSSSGNSSVQRLNPYVANKYSTNSLPDNDLGFATPPANNVQVSNEPEEKETSGGFFSSNIKGSVISKIYGDRVNTPTPPKETAMTGLDIIKSGVSFFKNKILGNK